MALTRFAPAGASEEIHPHLAQSLHSWSHNATKVLSSTPEHVELDTKKLRSFDGAAAITTARRAEEKDSADQTRTAH